MKKQGKATQDFQKGKRFGRPDSRCYHKKKQVSYIRKKRGTNISLLKAKHHFFGTKQKKPTLFNFYYLFSSSSSLLLRLFLFLLSLLQHLCFTYSPPSSFFKLSQGSRLSSSLLRLCLSLSLSPPSLPLFLAFLHRRFSLSLNL